MLPRLRAERALSQLQLAYAANERVLKDEDHAKFVEQLQREARGGAPTRVSAVSLETMGITVQMERGAADDASDPPPARVPDLPD